jgi:2-polyprenyl-3-methyl-5-hydroxy-6-metoxy-1,4-benzoquinol methylase
MRYRVKGEEVRSENAAKPTATASKWMLDWIDQLPARCRVLDLGCGKLRYTLPLSKQVKAITAVDSAAQIERVQTINGEAGSSVRAYADANLDNVKVFTLEENGWTKRRYDRIVIVNVLSAIPTVKGRLDVLRTAAKLLAPGGRVLVVTNFANTRFRDWKGEKRATPHLDGYLLKNGTGTSFYGMIPLAVVRHYCKKVGLTIEAEGTFHGENAWILAGK